jgi:hypothetical protein
MAAEFILLAWMLFREPSLSGTANIKKIHWLSKIKFWSIVLLIAIVVVAAKLAWTTSTNLLGILIVAPITGLFAGIAAASLICRDKIRVIKF